MLNGGMKQSCFRLSLSKRDGRETSPDEVGAGG